MHHGGFSSSRIMLVTTSPPSLWTLWGLKEDQNCGHEGLGEGARNEKERKSFFSFPFLFLRANLPATMLGFDIQ